MKTDMKKVLPDLREAFRKRTGIADIRIVNARVSRIETPADHEVAQFKAQFKAAFERAGGPPMISNGRPTIIRMVAWLAHEGINKNRLAFERDDLAQAALKIREPDFLPMDFNHSAVAPFSFDQKAVGVWYRAEMAQDPEAQSRWGILATGMMWAWMNPEIADRLLAEQSRNGRIDFSMACVPGKVTRAVDADGSYEIAGDTTFFTLSALDVPPADPDARGLGVEGSADPALETELKRRLTAGTAARAARHLRAAKARLPEGKQMDIDNTQPVEPQGAPEAPDLQHAVVEALDKKFAEFKNLQEMAVKVTSLEGQNMIAAERMKALNADLQEADARISDKELALEAANAELGKANAEIERLALELKAANDRIEKFEAAEAQKAAENRLVERMKTLPDAYVEAFTRRTTEEQNKAKARWTAMSDSDWAEFIADLTVMPVARSYFTRSREESVIPGAAPEAPGTVRSKLAQFRSPVRKNA